MFNKDCVESWNVLFPDCKIRDTDLNHPTENFLTKVLVSYPQSFGYKLIPPYPLNSDTNENRREKHKFLIILTRHIDHMLKITDKSYAFTYLDLIRPTPKKTSHTLSILLNYLYYYNMYKTDVFRMANETITTRMECQQRIDQIQKEHDQRENKAEQIKNGLKKLQTELPIKKELLKKLTNEYHLQKVQLQSMENEVRKNNDEIMQLRYQMRYLGLEIVTEKEANELKLQNTNLEEMSKQNGEYITASEKSLGERKKQLTHFEQLFDDVRAAKRILPNKMLMQFKSTKKMSKDSEKEIAELEAKKAQLQIELEQQQVQTIALESLKNNKKEQLESLMHQKLDEIYEKEKACKETTKNLKYKKDQEHKLECLIKEQNEIKQYLEDNITLLMEPYRK